MLGRVSLTRARLSAPVLRPTFSWTSVFVGRGTTRVRLPMLMRCWAVRALGVLCSGVGLVLSRAGDITRVAVVMTGPYASDVGVARIGCSGTSGKRCAVCRDGAGDLRAPVGAIDIVRAGKAG